MLLALFAALAAQAATAAPPAAIEGRWTNPSKDVIIAIAPCGERLCGKVEWATPQAQADARKGIANLIGADLLTGLSPSGANRWKGKLFVPDRKLRVTAKLSLDAADQLKVAGCAIGGMLCDSQVWTRAGPTNP
ncbi:MAG: DUF2147 domain-containing protein [Sphingomonas sp.]|nr:DUF2147 domain-containing protein [Sphingomonas sp.]